MFTWVLQRVADAGLLKGKTAGIDAMTLEANAALRSIVRRNTGEGYDAFLPGLAAASGIPTPTRAELARLDRKRPKKRSNDDRTHPQDPDAKIKKMKDGRTRLAHKAEHAVDLESGAVVGITVQNANSGDTTTMVETLITAAEQVEAVLPEGGGLAEVVADKGHHSNETMVALANLGLRSYVSEPDGGRRRWRGKGAARDAVYPNPRRIRRPRRGAAPAAARRTRGATQRPSLRDRGAPARVSAGSHQHPQAPPDARQRFEPGLSHATPDGRGHAAWPPWPRARPFRRPETRPEPLLPPHIAT